MNSHRIRWDQEILKNRSGPLEIDLGERDLPYALPRGRVDRIDHRGYDGRQRRLTDARGRERGFHKVHFDGRRLTDAQQRIAVEVRLQLLDFL